MRNDRQLSALQVQLFDVTHLIVYGQRRDAHNTSAALAVISLRLYVILIFGAVLERRQACAAWSSAGIKLRNIQQPGETACVCKTLMTVDFLHGHFLGFQPVLIGSHHVGLGLSLNPPHGASGVPNEQAVGCEQRHLGIIEDQRFSFGSVFFIGRDAAFAIFSENLALLQEFNRISQGIADSAAEDAAADSVQVHLCFHLAFQSAVDFFLIFIPIEMGKIAAEFPIIILLGGTAQNGKVDPAEHIAFAHTVEIEFLQRPVEQI